MENSNYNEREQIKKVYNTIKSYDKEYCRSRENFFNFYYSVIDSYKKNTSVLNVENIWGREVKAFIQYCREYGFRYLSVTDTSTGLMEILSELNNNGCKVLYIGKQYDDVDCFTSEQKMKDAIFFKIL